MTGLGPVPVKGITEPVEVYELTGAGPARYRLQAAVARGLSRFVGRDAEVERLREAFTRSRAGEGRLVALVGEPGVGKSRVIREFVEGPSVEGAVVLEGRPVAYRKTPSWMPVVDALRRYCQIDRLDGERVIREKITGKLLALDRALAPALPALLALADLEPEDPAWRALDPPQRRRRIQEAVRNVLLAESRRQPVVFVVEDLQRIDEETQALLDNLVDRLRGTRLLILVAYRPEYQHRWGSQPGYAQIRVDPFPPGTAHALLEEGVRRASALRILSRQALRLAWLAEGYLLAGRVDAAADVADQAQRLAAEHAEQGYAAIAQRMLGEIAARAERGTRAAEHYTEALARARALDMRPLEALCHFGLGALARRAGDGAAAKERLTEAVGLLRELDMRYWLSQAEAALTTLKP